MLTSREGDLFQTDSEKRTQSEQTTCNAAGQMRLLFFICNNVFHKAGLEWSL